MNWPKPAGRADGLGCGRLCADRLCPDCIAALTDDDAPEPTTYEQLVAWLDGALSNLGLPLADGAVVTCDCGQPTRDLTLTVERRGAGWLLHLMSTRRGLHEGIHLGPHVDLVAYPTKDTGAKEPSPDSQQRLDCGAAARSENADAARDRVAL